MKHRIAIMGVAAIAVGSMSGCGGDHGQAAMPPPPSMTSQSLNSEQVLAQARHTSETSSPYPVNDGALVLTDASDTTEPITITGP